MGVRSFFPGGGQNNCAGGPAAVRFHFTNSKLTYRISQSRRYQAPF